MTKLAARALIVVVATIAAAALADAQRQLGGSLVFTVPPAWELQQHKRHEQTELTVLGIPLPPEAQASASANVVIIGRTNESGIGLKDLVSAEVDRAKSGDPEFALQDMAWESDIWAVALATSRDGSTPYVLYDHYAATPNAAVSIRVALPMPRQTDEEWLSETVSQVNGFVQSLSIDGAGTGTVRLERIGNDLRLRSPPGKPN